MSFSIHRYRNAIKVTHAPTGIAVIVTDEQHEMRSYKRRYDRAMLLLSIRLRQRELLAKVEVDREKTGDLLETIGL